MEKRVIFPTIMFLTAGASFVFGIWQYANAQRVRAGSEERMAYIMTTIERSDVSRTQKKELYATIMTGLPTVPSLFGIEFSGSLAGQTRDDRCPNDGARTICRALKAQSADDATMSAVCGVCNPDL